MADFRIVNLRELEDQAVGFGLAPSLSARFARPGALGLEQLGLSLQRLGPGFRLPWGHRHRTQEEVYVVLSGSIRANLEGEIVELGPWDALRVPAATMRGFEGGPEGGELLVVGAPARGKPSEDVELEQGWWPE